MPASKYEQKAAEYRARAHDAARAAESCTLARLRRQHELASFRWSELAETEESRARTTRLRFAAAKPAELKSDGST